MLTWFRKYNPTRNRLHRIAATDERKCQKKQQNRALLDGRKLRSGENDETVMNEALMTYARENEAFSHIVAWQDEEVEMDMPPPSPQHPPGRNNKGKRPQASFSTDYKETLETISESLQKFVDLYEQKQYNNDMKLLWTPIDQLTGHASEMDEKTNEQIMKRYNMD
ncbi:hypothetical protein E3N88_15798 [Mikania micrantha]|uniref:Uncharacterized protein n=1 Tax=Mikania micrantha TaxID=192012 RepID=A0A5N6NXU1_9ASTR|nr:hypothetical protein E3N88_15798 [Mikania micrantha]